MSLKFQGLIHLIDVHSNQPAPPANPHIYIYVRRYSAHFTSPTLPRHLTHFHSIHGQFCYVSSGQDQLQTHEYCIMASLGLIQTTLTPWTLLESPVQTTSSLPGGLKSPHVLSWLLPHYFALLFPPNSHVLAVAPASLFHVSSFSAAEVL